MDLKVMPKSYKGDRYILCVIDEVTNYIITAPMKQARSEEIGEILINSVFSKYCVPDYIIMDLDKSYFQELTELKDLIDANNIVPRFLPKQTDINKILEIILRYSKEHIYH